MMARPLSRAVAGAVHRVTDDLGNRTPCQRLTWTSRIARKPPPATRHRLGRLDDERVQRQRLSAIALAGDAQSPRLRVDVLTANLGDLVHPQPGQCGEQNLLQSLARNHAVVDGNKRTAWAAAWTFLYINGVELDEFEVDDAEEFANAVATDGTLTIDHIASKLASYSITSL
jgi:hypothetical protein